MTHPRWDVDSGDAIDSWVTHRLLSQEHKALGVICRHLRAICDHADVVLISVLPEQT